MSRLVECKSCKHTVDSSAKTCPNCGVSKPGVKRTTWVWVLLSIFIVIAIKTIDKGAKQKAAETTTVNPSTPAEIAAAQPQQHNTTPPEIKGGTAQSYEVVSAEDLSNGYRKRHRWFIVSDTAKTFQDRAATVIKAAVDLKKQTRTQEAFILMNISKEHSDVIAMADYVYDSKDTPWKVQSSDVVLTKPLNKNNMPFIILKDVK